MSGVFKGKVLDFFTGRTLLSKKKHNEVIAAVNPLLNMEVTMGGGQTPSVNYSDTKVQIKIPRQQSSASSSNFHPFKIWEVPDTLKMGADVKKKCYAVRSGHIELRPRWYNPFPSNRPAFDGNNTWVYHDMAGGEIGDDVEDESAEGFGFVGSYFALDDISGISDEVIGGTNHGCYYAFWLEVNDAAANGYPSVAIKSRRWSISGNLFSAYPLKPFPSETYNGTLYLIREKEVQPIGILQYSAGGNPLPFIPSDAGIGIIPSARSNPAISQIQTTNFLNRYSGDVVTRLLGTFDNAQYRMYYPGDQVIYFGTDATDPTFGMYIATGIGQNGPAVTVPTDNAFAAFQYAGNLNPPSLTNPP